MNRALVYYLYNELVRQLANAMIAKCNFTALYIECSFDFSFSLFIFYLEGSAFQYICIYANAMGMFHFGAVLQKKIDLKNAKNQ